MYRIQRNVIKFVSDLRQVSDSLGTNKTDRHDITEILLKVALNTITLNPLVYSMKIHQFNQ